MATCYNYYGGYYTNCYSPWGTWGRWVALAAIIIFAFVIFCAFSILSARRRKRYGMNPYYGTNWVTRTRFGGHGRPVYNPEVGGQPQPYYSNAPQYNSHGAPPQYQQNHNGYYGPQSGGIELQQPASSYQHGVTRAEGEYAPPSGPPPKKSDGIIR